MAQRAKPRRRRRTVIEHGPEAVDTEVGRRVRVCRNLVGLTQEQLGDRIGVTFQQMQKYENGTNRISASRLWAISQVLDMSISWFFEDAGKKMPAAKKGEPGVRTKRETLQLVRYITVCSEEVRNDFIGLVKATAEASPKA
jgi:transcriptional regulator with XRE-family HTH domain